jgi:hypothetical protein
MDYADLEGLYATGHENKTPIKPEDEFFHSVYIAGQQRKNHAQITEEIGKLQIRGVEYNKSKLHFVITHVKNVLVKSSRNPSTNKETVECFSYQEGSPPWKGRDNKVCGTNSAERAANDFCRECRAQIIIAGILTNDGGKPQLTDGGKPTFIFLRGKGMKYSGVSEYLNKMSQLEIDASNIVTPPADPELKTKYDRFIKAVVNNKKYVTQLEVGVEESKFGDKNVFKLTQGAEVPDTAVKDVLTISKKTITQFNEKMNWSKLTPSGPAGSQIPESTPTESTPTSETVSNAIPETSTKEPLEEKAKEDSFTFDDIGF